MKASHKRVKGANLERKIAELIRASGLDKKAKRSFRSGAHWSYKSDIYTKLPFSIEAKWQETMSFWNWWEQAESNQSAMKPAILVHTANLRPIMVSMKFETFLNVLKELEDYKLGLQARLKNKEQIITKR